MQEFAVTYVSWINHPFTLLADSFTDRSADEVFPSQRDGCLSDPDDTVAVKRVVLLLLVSNRVTVDCWSAPPPPAAAVWPPCYKCDSCRTWQMGRYITYVSESVWKGCVLKSDLFRSRILSAHSVLLTSSLRRAMRQLGVAVVAAAAAASAAVTVTRMPVVPS